MKNKVFISDLGFGNIQSLLNLFKSLGIDSQAGTLNMEILKKGGPIVFPGVGNFSKAVTILSQNKNFDILHNLYQQGAPILGICLGAQIFCKKSEEGDGNGLGWINADVKRFNAVDGIGNPQKVPFMGWRTFAPPSDCLPFACPPGRMYFAHSYFIEPRDLSEEFPCQCFYGDQKLATVVKNKNAIGVQFHPEKSHRFGALFLKNWAEWAFQKTLK